MKKPRIKNWLKLFLGIIVAFIFIWEFYKSYPEIPEPISESYVLTNSPIVSALAVNTSASETVGGIVVENAGVAQPETLDSILTGSNGNVVSENNIDENRKKQLEAEINNLELQKNSLEENIVELKELNNKLSKISREIQKTIMKFIEKNRFKDMFTSALIGAIISTLFTFILSRPVIYKKIDNWLWKNISEKEN